MRYVRTDDTGSDNIIEIKGGNDCMLNLIYQKAGRDLI